MKLILLGAPGAGKGTQAAVISRELGIPAISTGNILRAAIQEGTPTGMKAKTYMDEGHLVPDEVIIGIIKERLAGAGKGTQAAVISRELGIPAISTGNILRAAIQEGTPTGMKAKTYMDEGHLVPDEVIIGIIKERLAEPDCAKGFILDGVPRTIAQAEALEAAGIKFDHVVSLEIADATIMERMSGRRVCSKCGASYHIVAVPPKAEGVCDVCGGELVTRKDDKPETVKNRLAVYHRETEPLKDFYRERGVLYPVEDMGPVEATSKAILAILRQDG